MQQVIDELEKALTHLMHATNRLGVRPLSNKKAIGYSVGCEKAVRRLLRLLKAEKEE